MSHSNKYPNILLDKTSPVDYYARMDETKGKYLTTPNFNTAFTRLEECVACINLWFQKTPATPVFILRHITDKTYHVVPVKAINRESVALAFRGNMIIFQGSLAMLRDIARGFPIDLFSPPEIAADREQ